MVQSDVHRPASHKVPPACLSTNCRVPLASQGSTAAESGSASRARALRNGQGAHRTLLPFKNNREFVHTNLCIGQDLLLNFGTTFACLRLILGSVASQGHGGQLFPSGKP